MGKVVLSTGVLGKAPRTITALVNLLSLDSRIQEVTVEIWNWSSTSPVKLPVFIGNHTPVTFPYRLSSENLAVMYTDLKGVLFYEIRITMQKERNIIANCYGRSITLAPQASNTVLNGQLVKINPNCYV